MVDKFCLIPISLHSGSGLSKGMASIVHWQDLDEDLSISGLLAGRQSGEVQQSLARWLEGRRIGI